MDSHPQEKTAAKSVDIEALGEQIAELAAHIHAATYRLMCLIREFDKRAGWQVGFRSCAHWLSWRVGYDLTTAREKVRTARALEQLPQLSQAVAKGSISYSKIRELTRIATPENEAELLDIANAGTASHVEKLVRKWRGIVAAENKANEEAQYEGRYLSIYHDEHARYPLPIPWL